MSDTEQFSNDDSSSLHDYDSDTKPPSSKSAFLSRGKSLFAGRNASSYRSESAMSSRFELKDKKY